MIAVIVVVVVHDRPARAQRRDGHRGLGRFDRHAAQVPPEHAGRRDVVEFVCSLEEKT